MLKTPDPTLRSKPGSEMVIISPCATTVSDRKDNSKFVEEPATAGKQESEECTKSVYQIHTNKTILK